MIFSAASLLEPVSTFFGWWGTQISNVWNSLYGVMFVGFGLCLLYGGWKKSENLGDKEVVGFDGAPHTVQTITPVWVRLIFTAVSTAISALVFVLFMYASHIFFGLF